MTIDVQFPKNILSSRGGGSSLCGFGGEFIKLIQILAILVKGHFRIFFVEFYQNRKRDWGRDSSLFLF
jgi:hypothetical protein